MFVHSRQPCARPSVLSKVANIIGVFFEAHVPEKYIDFHCIWKEDSTSPLFSIPTPLCYALGSADLINENCCVILSGGKWLWSHFPKSNISIRKCDLVVDRIGISFKSVEVKRKSNCHQPTNWDPERIFDSFAFPFGKVRLVSLAQDDSSSWL